ncbi:xanthine dehydrogenase family protein molybdopterin-binding subunit [Flavobacteriaceae bacterium TP-CH-4]|uniref:Xanthine dehydrogenase family protein molybdopterin-binding subunit n=1 Tax=Pelagihabitans pacificus TaxID=2696054 RepID=A0A967E4B2_9FLAO|nr:molybdopterin cofactor-binding domain-containing protein [Pelagihabitans pacificus]NHF58202.1 xanthine dehydrogenase family protein molybdopterin-binding subunit [Pelagihabitans pacificus]
MRPIQTKIGRRAFIKNTSLASGGLVLGFSILNACKPKQAETMAVREMPKEWFEINAYLKIGENGLVTIMAPNPEFGQGVITSMPMILADELDVAWEDVLVEQAPFDANLYGRQFTGGSQGIRRRWEGLRMAGATAKQMLKEAAAQAWQVPVAEITVSEGILSHDASGNSAGYGEMAAAASKLAVPEKVTLKAIKDFTIIGTSKKSVENKKIVTGKPLFGTDYQYEGALIAMVEHPPAFGLQLKSFDAGEVRSMPGIVDVLEIKTMEDGFKRGYFDTNAFTSLIAIVGKTTWEVMNAKKRLKAEWEPIADSTFKMDRFGTEMEVKVPKGLESTEAHYQKMTEMATRTGTTARKDGKPEAAFKNAAKVIERSYSCPFLAHNCMEPMNFFAHVTDEGAKLAGPLQAPGLTEPTVAARLGIPVEKVDIELTRMGGGFGRRAYGHYAVEAALISKEVKAPVKLVYSREDDMTFGIYRPAYYATYRAALDENNNLVAFHVKAGGIPETPLFANRFPAGAVDNYLAEQWEINSNITIGAFRAPRSNFMAGVEQAFLDEVAETAGKDPIDFRMELLERAKNNPVGQENDYEPDRLAGVLKLVREKANWGETRAGVHRGVSAYFCHNSYAAHVVDVVMEGDSPKVEKVVCAVDCGIVVNPDAAANMAEGAIVDGVGNAMYGELTFKNGSTEQTNFDRYRIIRHSEAPKHIEVHFVQNEIDPTGLGEPPFPPVFGALANALYKATGRRHYRQPFVSDRPPLVG